MLNGSPRICKIRSPKNTCAFDCAFSFDPIHPITPSTTRSRITLAAPNVKTLNVSGCFIIFFLPYTNLES